MPMPPAPPALPTPSAESARSEDGEPLESRRGAPTPDWPLGDVHPHNGGRLLRHTEHGGRSPACRERSPPLCTPEPRPVRDPVQTRGTLAVGHPEHNGGRAPPAHRARRPQPGVSRTISAVVHARTAPRAGSRPNTRHPRCRAPRAQRRTGSSDTPRTDAAARRVANDIRRCARPNRAPCGIPCKHEAPPLPGTASTTAETPLRHTENGCRSPAFRGRSPPLCTRRAPRTDAAPHARGRRGREDARHAEGRPPEGDRPCGWCWLRCSAHGLVVRALCGVLRVGEGIGGGLLSEESRGHRVLQLGLDLLTSGRGSERRAARCDVVVRGDRLVEAGVAGLLDVGLADRLIGLGRSGEEARVDAVATGVCLRRLAREPRPPPPTPRGT